MDYADHLSRYGEKLQAEQRELARQQEAARIALRHSHEEAQNLIRSVLRPEFERLKEALEAAGVRAKVTVGHGRAVDADADYEVEVKIEDEPSRYKYLKFEASADRKIFTACTSSGPRSENYVTESFRYDQITSQLAASCCSNWMKLAFPL